jgi:hypothetical protein
VAGLFFLRSKQTGLLSLSVIWSPMMPLDPPPKANQQSPLPSQELHEKEREQLIKDLAFLVVQKHRRNQRNQDPSNPFGPVMLEKK